MANCVCFFCKFFNELKYFVSRSRESMSEGPARQAVALHAHVRALPQDVVSAERRGLGAARLAQGQGGHAALRQVSVELWRASVSRAPLFLLPTGTNARAPALPRPTPRRPHTAVDYSEGPRSPHLPREVSAPRTALPKPTSAGAATPAAAGTNAVMLQVLQRQAAKARGNQPQTTPPPRRSSTLFRFKHGQGQVPDESYFPCRPPRG